MSLGKEIQPKQRGLLAKFGGSVEKNHWTNLRRPNSTISDGLIVFLYFIIYGKIKQLFMQFYFTYSSIFYVIQEHVTREKVVFQLHVNGSMKEIHNRNMILV